MDFHGKRTLLGFHLKFQLMCNFWEASKGSSLSWGKRWRFVLGWCCQNSESFHAKSVASFFGFFSSWYLIKAFDSGIKFFSTNVQVEGLNIKGDRIVATQPLEKDDDTRSLVICVPFEVLQDQELVDAVRRIMTHGFFKRWEEHDQIPKEVDYQVFVFQMTNL